jgi:small GTP-binding protein
MEPTSLKVVLLGDAGVGKTCIIKQFIEHKFDKGVLSSLSAQFVSKTIEYVDFGKAIKFDIWDTVGQEKYRAMTKIFYKDAKVIILVFDLTSLKSFKAIEEYWCEEIKNNCAEKPVIAVVGNKTDLYSEKKVDVDDAKDLAKKMKAIFQLTSAKNNDGITNLFDNIGKKYLQPSFEYDAKEKQAKENYEKKKQKEKNTRIMLNKGNGNNNENEGGEGNKNKKGCC